jgi:hypothetical protein
LLIFGDLNEITLPTGRFPFNFYFLPKFVPPKERLRFLKSYSQPMSNGDRCFIIHRVETAEEKRETKRILKMERKRNQAIKKRLNGTRTVSLNVKELISLTQASRSKKDTVG